MIAVALLAVLLAFCQVAFAEQTWQTGSLNKYTSLLGVYATQASEVYGSVLDNAVGTGILRSSDYATTGTFYGPVGAMNMDVAFTANGQVGAVVGVGGIFYGPPSSADFTKVDGVRAITQNVESLSSNGLAVTGEFSVGKNSYNGVTVTLDGGKTWASYDSGLDPAQFPARYGAFPSETTWFVAGGAWPYDASEATETADAADGTKAVKLSARLSVSQKPGEKAPSFDLKPKKNLRSGDSGYTGAIAKTTDGGKTWAQVYSSNGLFYFNQIHCADVSNCVAVGENGETAFAVGSQDGGQTWATTFSAPAGMSLVAARMLSPTEAWIAGGLQQRGNLLGYYYHTTDAGATWTEHTLSGYAFDLSFKDGVGYSAFLTQSYSSVAIYN